LKSYILISDGACSKNPGPGGWGMILVTPEDLVFEFGGHESETTNNRMELMGLYRGMQEIYKIEKKNKLSNHIHVITDSKYVLDGASKYVANWSRSAWRTSTGTEVKNQDLWEKILKGFTELKKFKMSFEYELVKGHSGHDANERCDQIAVAFSKNEEISLYEGTLDDYSVKIGKNLIGEEFETIYLSYVDGVLSKHLKWSDCQKATAGKSGAKFKKVTNSREMQETLKLWGL
jgi:ribonuclease HI